MGEGAPWDEREKCLRLTRLGFSLTPFPPKDLPIFSSPLCPLCPLWFVKKTSASRTVIVRSSTQRLPVQCCREYDGESGCCTAFDRSLRSNCLPILGTSSHSCQRQRWPHRQCERNQQHQWAVHPKSDDNWL